MRPGLDDDVCNLRRRHGRVDDAPDLNTAGLAIAPDTHFTNRPAQRGVDHHPLAHINAGMGHVAAQGGQRFGA